MKKLVKLNLVSAFLLIFALSGCGSADPVAEDLTRFVNTDMAEVNENSAALREETDKWESFVSDSEFIESLTETVLPNVNESLELIKDVAPETEEVDELKEKYRSVLLAYKDGYGTILQGFQSGDSDKLEAGALKVKEGNSLLDEYNAALSALAEGKGLSAS